METNSLTLTCDYEPIDVISFRDYNTEVEVEIVINGANFTVLLNPKKIEQIRDWCQKWLENQDGWRTKMISIDDIFYHIPDSSINFMIKQLRDYRHAMSLPKEPVETIPESAYSLDGKNLVRVYGNLVIEADTRIELDPRQEEMLYHVLKERRSMRGQNK